MPRLVFVGQSSRDDDNRQANTSRLLNFYREPLGQGGISTHTLKSVPGTSLLTIMGGESATLFVRDMKEIGGRFYVMAGGMLYQVREDGGQTELGETASAEGARIFGAEQGRVCTVSGGRYFVWDGVSMLEPAAGAFSQYGSGTFFGNYVVLTEQEGRRFLWSDLADATSLPALNFNTAETTDKNILRTISLSGRLWIMKEDVIEQWYVTQQAGARAFARISGGVLEVGLKAAGLVTRFTGGVFFVGSDNIAYISSGSQTQPVSAPPVNTSLAQSNPTECYAYEDEGHQFCVIRFNDRPAWVYDIVTGEWHERAISRDDPWNIRVATQAFGNFYGGDVLGRVYLFERNNEDAGQSLVRTAVSSTLYNEGQRFRVPRLEFTGRVGIGGTEYDIDPKIVMRTSRDGGLNWSLGAQRSLGDIGDYDQFIWYRGLGSFRRLTVEISLSAPRDVTMDASANVVIA